MPHSPPSAVPCRHQGAGLQQLQDAGEGVQHRPHHLQRQGNCMGLFSSVSLSPDCAQCARAPGPRDRPIIHPHPHPPAAASGQGDADRPVWPAHGCAVGGGQSQHRDGLRVSRQQGRGRALTRPAQETTGDCVRAAEELEAGRGYGRGAADAPWLIRLGCPILVPAPPACSFRFGDGFSLFLLAPPLSSLVHARACLHARDRSVCVCVCVKTSAARSSYTTLSYYNIAF
jgi:hypothetical protein